MNFHRIIDAYDSVENIDGKIVAVLEKAQLDMVDYYKPFINHAKHMDQRVFMNEFNTFGEIRPRCTGKTKQILEYKEYVVSQLGYKEEALFYRNNFMRRHTGVNNDFHVLVRGEHRIFLLSDTAIDNFNTIFEQKMRGAFLRLPPLVIKIYTPIR